MIDLRSRSPGERRRSPGARRRLRARSVTRCSSGTIRTTTATPSDGVCWSGLSARRRSRTRRRTSKQTIVITWFLRSSRDVFFVGASGSTHAKGRVSGVRWTTRRTRTGRTWVTGNVGRWPTPACPSRGRSRACSSIATLPYQGVWMLGAEGVGHRRRCPTARRRRTRWAVCRRSALSARPTRRRRRRASRCAAPRCATTSRACSSTRWAAPGRTWRSSAGPCASAPAASSARRRSRRAGTRRRPTTARGLRPRHERVSRTAWPGATPTRPSTTRGVTVRCQWWGRDQGFAPPCNTTLSDALEYVVSSPIGFLDAA